MNPHEEPIPEKTTVLKGRGCGDGLRRDNGERRDQRSPLSVETTEVSSRTILAPVKGARFESGNRETDMKKLLVEKGLTTPERKKKEGEKKTLSHARLYTPEEFDTMTQDSTIGSNKVEE
ncbi:hypothetical protein PC116_g9864 [Phytophthora cactorum]|uniref:Uncharacterized protein n=1 Tax=Phytophthora cactorum TaxID=29920 RepID=A0A8T0ZPY5_9STRA|nr:hypothetical protein Pcac1_g16018 [Phytophthora cactorum]KAG2815940.1 hypothetical protein PC112_g13665 [Phytophthora cactorum]KAG2864113.1 hypothetical protein PC113_g4869 [Phytophthora cactorum]KAG3020067.1 hypothetical protein PC119_g10110 [Phytophthora cactorum]KAG3189930.1 hypothetical protein PC128_g11556 [Phytophthora cactorum]